MFEKYAKKTTEYFIKNKVICQDDEEIYNYGFEILLSTFFSILLTIIIGVFAKKFLEALIFLLIYCSLRIEAGGFHASTHFRCTFTFILAYVVILFVTPFVNIPIMKVIIIPLLLLCLLCFAIIAPVEDMENLLEKDKMKIMKKTACSLLAIYILIILFCFFHCEVFIKYSIIGTMAIFWESILLIAGMCKAFLYRRRYKR